MEIQELYHDEVARLAQVGKDALGVRFPSWAELRGLRDNPRVFLAVAVAGAEIVGIALAELRDERGSRGGSVRPVASFLGEVAVDRAVTLPLLSLLEAKFKTLEADESEVPGDQDPDRFAWLERSGDRPATPAGRSPVGDQPSPPVVREAAFPPWARPPAASPPGPGVVE